MTNKIAAYLLTMPTTHMALIVIGGTVVLAWLLIVIAIYASPAKLKAAYIKMLPNLGASMIIGFAIFASLLANSVWRDREVAHNAVQQEARALRLAALIVDERQHPVWRATIVSYAAAVVQEEWQTMSDGIENLSARQTLDQLHKQVLDALPDISAETRKVLIDTLKDIETARQVRLTAAADEIPFEIWLAVLLSAWVILTFSALGHAHAPIASFIMGTFAGLVIGSMLFAIIAVDRPFLGEVSVANTPIAEVAAKR